MLQEILYLFSSVMSRTTAKRMGKSTETKNMYVGESSTSQQNESDGNKGDSDSEISVDVADCESKSKYEQSSESDPKGPKAVLKSEDNKNCTLINLYFVIAVSATVIGIIAFVSYTNERNEDDKITHSFVDVDKIKIWENGLQDLQLNFTGQTERFWNILKRRGLAHLRKKQPRQPLVFLMAAVPNAHDEVDCLATKLAELLDPDQKNNLTKINGRELQNKPGGETKKIMDDILFKTFKKGKKVAIVYHLHLLPPPSPILFYSYCDDQNAPYKRVAMVFTVHLPRAPDPSLSPVEAAGSVEKFLQQEVWTDSPYNQDEIAALLSRIADTVLLMNSSDKNTSLKTFCES